MKPEHPFRSRREFFAHSAAALAATTLVPSALRAAPTSRPTTVPRGLGQGVLKSKDVDTLRQTGWNIWSSRFVDAPTWTWEAMKGAAGYVIEFAEWNEKSATTAHVKDPVFDMTEYWPKVPIGVVDLIAWAVDADGKPICTAWRKRIVKSGGWDGVKQEPMDWKASIDRSMEYLLAPARDEVKDYEKGLPRSAWSCCEDNITGQRRFLMFPALHYPSFIFAYLTYAQQFPDSKLTPAAITQAKQYADWQLTNRLPADWKCSLFPFSTIEDGRTEAYIEGRNITLFRAARVGEAMVTMFQHFKQQQYLDYARHIADKLIELQRPDGSWPYRIDPMDGRVVQDYTSNAVSPARLFGILEDVEPNARYQEAREKAIAWVMANPVRTRRWEGMFEDVSESSPFRDLDNWDAHELVRYLVHYHRDDPKMAQAAEELNHYIEDQFVVWQDGDLCTPERCPTPMVLEQYTCYHPMESHTGHWMMTLMALHRATGKEDYITKAIAAANAIVKTQQPSGAYSTWGFDVRFNRPPLTLDWPGCNCVAILGLLQFMEYLPGLPGSRREIQPI
jgi:hypothetical protein